MPDHPARGPGPGPRGQYFVLGMPRGDDTDLLLDLLGEVQQEIDAEGAHVDAEREAKRLEKIEARREAKEAKE